MGDRTSVKPRKKKKNETLIECQFCKKALKDEDELQEHQINSCPAMFRGNIRNEEDNDKGEKGISYLILAS